MQKRSSFHLFVLSLWVLSGCSATEYTLRPESAVEYRLIYLIHGDASYRYHMRGEDHQADEKVLEEALELAARARQGEVFIFHQKPEKARFLFFPGKDRKWYHFVNGKLVGESAYSSASGGLSKEASIYRRHKTGKEVRTVFQYFGHEIPTSSFTAYHRSQPGLNFDTEIFSRDLSLFEDRFALTMLSTCNNGNPLMAARLMEQTRYLVASPRNLHLSHLDTQQLLLLEEQQDISTHALADSVARHSFQRLSAALQTMVTIGVYDLQAAASYLPGLANRYEQHLENIQQRTLFEDNTDCASLPVFGDAPLPEEGTHLYFQPPAFGREAGLTTHSSWGCKK